MYFCQCDLSGFGVMFFLEVFCEVIKKIIEDHFFVTIENFGRGRLRIGNGRILNSLIRKTSVNFRNSVYITISKIRRFFYFWSCWHTAKFTHWTLYSKYSGEKITVYNVPEITPTVLYARWEFFIFRLMLPVHIVI